MKKLLFILLFAFPSMYSQLSFAERSNYVTIKGENLITPEGKKLFIKGTNLGNWLNPEGYMFGFKNTNCEWMINDMVSEMVGPDFAVEFWKAFKDNYITREDIDFIASTGANTIRLPFNYKIFTDENYMGLNSKQEGFSRVDSVVNWCRVNGLYVILDMHDAPGGQTGDNIDNSYGYPWLFESERSQQTFCNVWREIADHYKNEPVILGYELINEPIAPYFKDVETLNSKLEIVHKMAVKIIREVDKNHIILLGGSQWNSNFQPFTDWKYDDKIMYTCHRYGGEPTKEAIKSFIDFRDKTGLPMYMGEIGHNTDRWQADFCKVMRENNIGYTFWPYKKIDDSCMMGFKRPAEWDSVVVKYAEAQRTTFKDMRELRPDQNQAKKALMEYVENSKFENCIPQKEYIQSMGLVAK